MVDRAQAEIYEVTERRTSEDYVAIEDLLQPTLDEIEQIASSGAGSGGIPTGFGDLDDLTNGLHPGQMITVAGPPGLGQVHARPGLRPVCSIKHGKPASSSPWR